MERCELTFSGALPSSLFPGSFFGVSCLVGRCVVCLGLCMNVEAVFCCYKERVLNVEHGSFTPLIFTTTGGVGPEANRHHKRIAQLMAIKKKGEYSQIISYIRTRLRFNLLKSILVAVRGERGRRTRAGPISAIEFGQIPLPQD